MAIAFGSSLTSNTGTGNSITTASITPTAGNVTILSFYARNNTTATPTVSGCNLTWSQVSVSNSSTDQQIWWGVGGSPSAGTISVTGLNGNSSNHWHVSHFSGVSTTAPILQALRATGSGNTASVTLASSVTANNAAFGFTWQNGTATMSAGSGYTEISELADGTRRTHTEYGLSKSGSTTITSNWTGGTTWSIIGFEISVPVTGSKFRRKLDGMSRIGSRSVR